VEKVEGSLIDKNDILLEKHSDFRMIPQGGDTWKPFTSTTALK